MGGDHGEGEVFVVHHHHPHLTSPIKGEGSKGDPVASYRELQVKDPVIFLRKSYLMATKRDLNLRGCCTQLLRARCVWEESCRKINTTALYVSAFCLKRALLLLVPLLLLLLHFMDMLYCFLLLALFLTLPAALVSHCAPPLHLDSVHVIIIAWFFFVAVERVRWGEYYYDKKEREIPGFVWVVFHPLSIFLHIPFAA